MLKTTILSDFFGRIQLLSNDIFLSGRYRPFVRVAPGSTTVTSSFKQPFAHYWKMIIFIKFVLDLRFFFFLSVVKYVFKVKCFKNNGVIKSLRKKKKKQPKWDTGRKVGGRCNYFFSSYLPK